MKIKLFINFSAFIIIAFFGFIFVKPVSAATPVGLWQFGENTGATAKNVGSAGSAINVSLSSSGMWTASGKVGYAIASNGTTYATAPDDNSIDFNYNQSFTVAFWMKDGAGNALDDAIVEKYAAGAYPYAFRWYTGGKIAFKRWDGTNNPAITSTTAINDSAWHYIVGSYNSTEDKIHLYIDNVEQGTGTTDTTTTTTTNAVTLCIATRCGSGSFNWVGTIDTLKIYNSALSADESYADYMGFCGFPISGNFTVSGSCNIDSAVNIDGADAGTAGGANTSVLTLGQDTTLTLNSGQTMAFGSINLASTNAVIYIGSGATLVKGHVCVNDGDGDGYAATNPPTRTTGTCQSAGYSLRSGLAGASGQLGSYVPPAVGGTDISSFTTLSAITADSFPSPLSGTGNIVYLIGRDDNVSTYGTTYKATVDGSNNLSAFSTTSQTALPVPLVHQGMALINTTGTTYYIYTLGGYSGSANYSTVYRGTIDSSGNITGWADTSKPISAVLRWVCGATVNISGTNYIYATGGLSSDGTNSVATVQKAVVNADGSLGNWSTLTAITAATARHTCHIKNINGTNYLYIIGGGAVTGTYSDKIYIGTLNSSGNITGWATNSNNLPATLMASTTQMVTIGSNTYLYFFGGWKGGAQSADVQRAVVNSNGTIGAFSATNQNDLPATNYWQKSFVKNNAVFVIGGFSHNTSVYRATFQGTVSTNIDCNDSDASITPPDVCQ